MTNPIVTNIDFVQKDILEVTFNQPVWTNLETAGVNIFYNTGNYQIIPVNGGEVVTVLRVSPDLVGDESRLTRKAYLFIQGGSIGATYEAIFKNLVSPYVSPAPAPIMLPGENTFTFVWRKTRLDSLRKSFPKIMDTEYASTLWSVLGGFSKSFTTLGG